MSASSKKKPDIGIEITANPDMLVLIRGFANCLAEQLNLSPSDALKLELCVDEACSNSIQAIRRIEGNQPCTKVRIEVEINPDTLRIIISDGGENFNHFFQNADPLCPHTDRTKTRGYGLKIIKTFMDEVIYDHDPDLGNRLYLIKFITKR